MLLLRPLINVFHVVLLMILLDIGVTLKTIQSLILDVNIFTIWGLTEDAMHMIKTVFIPLLIIESNNQDLLRIMFVIMYVLMDFIKIKLLINALLVR